jgi:hypothetical protein
MPKFIDENLQDVHYTVYYYGDYSNDFYSEDSMMDYVQENLDENDWELDKVKIYKTETLTREFEEDGADYGFEQPTYDIDECF